MRSLLNVMIGGALSVGLVVAALWAWQDAATLASEWSRPEVAVWSVRSAAVGAVAMAQVIVLTFVVGAWYGRDLFGDLLRGAAAAVFAVALVSAVALGLVGR